MRRCHGLGLTIQFATPKQSELHNRRWKCVQVQTLLRLTPLSCPSFSLSYPFNSSWFCSAKLVSHAASNGSHYCIVSLSSYISTAVQHLLLTDLFFLYSPLIFLYPSSTKPIILFLDFFHSSCFTMMPGIHGNSTYESNSWRAFFQTFCPPLHAASIGMKSVSLKSQCVSLLCSIA